MRWPEVEDTSHDFQRAKPRFFEKAVVAVIKPRLFRERHPRLPPQERCLASASVTARGGFESATYG